MGPRDQWTRSQAVFAPAVQVTSYGLQESGGPVTFVELADSEQVRGSTCGRPMAGYEVRIADPETGRLLGPGTLGEILVRGPGQFSGYYRDPTATSRMVDGEGFIHTGDLGIVDEDGRVTFKDRIKNMLKVGGENVAPAEIETVLLTHPAVAAAVVVGIPDDRLDQVPAAFLELREGINVLPEEIIAYCSQRLARFKVPRLIRFVKEWPMSATKVQASKLRDRLIEELEESRPPG
jgi:acyl-CoA synthetase (AMP-forming)/AMP-acid ligase II